MDDSSKTLIGTIAGFAALVSVFALMADCSKSVARVNAKGADCVAKGGRWLTDETIAPGGVCLEKSK